VSEKSGHIFTLIKEENEMKEDQSLRALWVSVTFVIVLSALSNGLIAAHNAESVTVPWASLNVDAAALFGAKCAICHGKTGTGMAKWKSAGQPDFTDAEWQKSHSDSQIADTIKNGKGKYMPAYKEKLSAEEIAALVGRVRAFGKK
jgi:mono/diheme cytochrome c family protein